MPALNLLKTFFTDDQGLEAVEYAILTGLIVVAALGALASIGLWVANVFNTLQNQVNA